jgi:hypothetical protein
MRTSLDNIVLFAASLKAWHRRTLVRALEAVRALTDDEFRLLVARILRL